MRAMILALIWAAAVNARGEPVSHDDVTYPAREYTTACMRQSAHPATYDDTRYPDAEVVIRGCEDDTGGAAALASTYDDVTYPAREKGPKPRKLVVIEGEEGLQPEEVAVHPGEAIELVLRTEGSTPCAVTVKELGLRTTLQPNAVGRMTFTAPRSGALTLECVATGDRAKLIVD